MPTLGRERKVLPYGVVLAAATGAATWAVMASLLIVPYLSINRDETVYLLQADALRHGQLFPPAPEPSEAFTPWFAVESAGRFVVKYTPVHGAALALARLAFGTERAALAIFAAAAVGLTFMLGVEVLASRRQAAFAVVLLATSPLFLMQTMTFLSYVGNLVLLLGFAVALLRGVRTGQRPLLVVAGFALGLAAFARPFDAVLFAAPFGLWFVARHLRMPNALAAQSALVMAGLALPLATMLWFNRAATGNLLQFPFSILEPLDTIGFGPRRLLPTDPVLNFTPRVALDTTTSYLALFSRWCGGGLVLLGLTVPGLWRSRGPALAVSAVALTVPAGYFFFWGPSNVSFMTPLLGPFYYVPLLVPVVLAGARGMARLTRWSQPLGAAALVAMVACSGAVTERAIRANLRQTTAPRAIEAPFEGQDLDNALVFLPGKTLGNPFGFARNESSFSGSVIWSLDRKSANFAVLDKFPGRTPYALRVPTILGGDSKAGDPQPIELEKLQVVRSGAVEWPITAQNRSDLTVVNVEVSVDGGLPAVETIDRGSQAGKSHEGVLLLTADRVTFTPASGGEPVTFAVDVGGKGLIRVIVTASDARRSSVRTMAGFTATYRIVGRDLEVLGAAEPIGGVGGPRPSGADFSS